MDIYPFYYWVFEHKSYNLLFLTLVFLSKKSTTWLFWVHSFIRLKMMNWMYIPFIRKCLNTGRITCLFLHLSSFKRLWFYLCWIFSFINKNWIKKGLIRYISLSPSSVRKQVLYIVCSNICLPPKTNHN